MTKKGLLLGIVTALMLSVTACGSSSESFDAAMPMENMTATEEKWEESAAGVANGSADYVSEEASASQQQTDRKLIKTVSMDVETKEYDEFLVMIQEEVTRLGGYIERLDSYNGSVYSDYRRDRYADMVIRIPQNQLTGFLGSVEGVSNVISRSENVQDVTLSYVDLESRKEVLLIEQERLLTFLEQAQTMEDIIVLEERLSEIRYEIESKESQLRTYDNKITYSTVYLNVQEVKELTPIAEETAWERIAGGFMDNVEEIIEGVKEFFIELVIMIPYIVLWTIVIALFIIAVRKYAKVSKKRKERQATKENEGKESEGN